MCEIRPYLSRLCETLVASMTDDSRPISLKVQAEDGTASSAEAVSIGLIVTELVINAFKHAFVGDRAGHSGSGGTALQTSIMTP